LRRAISASGMREIAGFVVIIVMLMVRP